MGQKTTKLVLFDNTDKLSIYWRLGSTIDRTPHSYGVSSWDEAMTVIEHVHRITGEKLDVQVWGHGNDGKVYIAGRHLPLDIMAKRCQGMLESFWARSCETIKGAVGRAWAEEFVAHMDCDYIGHEVITNWPNPLWQGKCAALKRGQKAWWHLEELKGCLTTRMKPPKHAYRSGPRYRSEP